MESYSDWRVVACDNWNQSLALRRLADADGLMLTLHAMEVQNLGFSRFIIWSEEGKIISKSLNKFSSVTCVNLTSRHCRVNTRVDMYMLLPFGS